MGEPNQDVFFVTGMLVIAVGVVLLARTLYRSRTRQSAGSGAIGKSRTYLVLAGAGIAIVLLIVADSLAH
jgi:hypothetical protein